MDTNPTPASGAPETFRSGFVGLIGKPNVGKSTILNYFLGRKISITSPRPQTTRRRIMGILTRPDAQIVFIDTPGWHRPENPLGRMMVTTAKGVMEEADVLVMVLEATSGIREEDEWVFNEVRKAKHPAIVAINKVDAVKKGLVLPLLEHVAALRIFEEHIPISAKTNENMEVLLEEAVKRLPTGPRWYEEGQLTDQSAEQLISEFIREQALQLTRQEVPQAIAVLIDERTEKETVTLIRATILVEREGQKAIVIGRQGQMLKRIGTVARMEIERFLGRKVFLELWVKVIKTWRKDPVLLRQLGYSA